MGPFWFDVLACVPVLVYEAAHGFTNDFENKSQMINNSPYQVYMAFKLLKITKLATINQSSFYIEEYLTEIYITHRIVLEITL